MRKTQEVNKSNLLVKSMPMKKKQTQKIGIHFVEIFPVLRLFIILLQIL